MNLEQKQMEEAKLLATIAQELPGWKNSGRRSTMGTMKTTSIGSITKVSKSSDSKG